MNPLTSLAARAAFAVPTRGDAAQPVARSKGRADSKLDAGSLGKAPEKASPEEVLEAAQEIGTFLKQRNSRLELEQEPNRPSVSYADLAFQVDKDTGIAFFKVIDARTREVIRQVPSEEVLAMARKLRELSGQADASGVLMNEEG